MTDETETEEPASLFSALLAAQAEMEPATINKQNPHFKNRYADLGAVRDAVIPVLTKHGILVSQLMQYDPQGRYVMQTELIHVATGEARVAVFPLPDSGKPQEIGAAITYARRYTLVAATGLTSEEDDDGEGAGKVKRRESDIGPGNEQPHGKPVQGITTLKTAIRALTKIINECEDFESLEAAIHGNRQDIMYCAYYLPGWWVLPDDNMKGLLPTLESKITDLAPNEQAHNALMTVLIEAGQQEKAT